MEIQAPGFLLPRGIAFAVVSIWMEDSSLSLTCSSLFLLPLLPLLFPPVILTFKEKNKQTNLQKEKAT